MLLLSIFVLEVMLRTLRVKLILLTLLAIVSVCLLFTTLAVHFAIALGVGVFLLLNLFLDRQVNRPLNQLVAAMNAVEGGNLEVRVDLKGEDEISRLGKHFNRTLARIEKTDTENRELVARLSRFNKELEVRVTQVTRELSERSAELLRLQREMIRVGPLAALGRITGTIAHELGTPLNSVLGYTQLLLQEELPENAQRRLKIIESQVQRMVDTIQYYLSRTRGSLRRQQQVNVNELVQETLGLLEPLFQQHQVQVSTALAEPFPPLSADSALLQRMLINLLNNAIDAMEEGGTVAVATRAAAPPEAIRRGIVLEVMDTGSGIPPELLPKVFDLFVTTKTPGQGTGLGLAICQEIVRAHGGTIDITSQMGKGTCVRIFLPADEMAHQSVAVEGKV